MLSNSLCASVQHNCNIADAKHASNYTLCTYLMKMREYYRWEKGYSYSKPLPKEEVGEWVAKREGLWERLEEETFSPIEIDGKSFDPFETDKINAALLEKGMVYSGGLGQRAVPHFFLGRLDTTQRFEGFQVIITSEECARDLGAPPAMTLGNTIFIRKESVRRMLWEKVQEWQWHKHENAMARAVAYYDFDNNLERALNHMTDIETEVMVLHEIGEIKATNLIGSEWKEFLLNISNSRAELMLRAVKDLFADSISTLPTLMENRNEASIHFYAGNISAMRKELCPSFMANYEQWLKTYNYDTFNNWIIKNSTHWQLLIEQVLALYKDRSSLTEIEQLIEANRL